MEQAALKKWALVALDLGVDTTTPSGKLMANMMASVAEWEREVIGLRTKDALAVKRREGKQLGRPRMLPERTYRRIQRMRAQGLSLQAIANRLNNDGTPTAHGGERWHASTVRAALNRTSG
jgi:DNA invertase Pin-like site-specific DNA recombinase